MKTVLTMYYNAINALMYPARQALLYKQEEKKTKTKGTLLKTKVISFQVHIFIKGPVIYEITCYKIPQGFYLTMEASQSLGKDFSGAS